MRAFLAGGLLGAALIYYLIESIDLASFWIPMFVFIAGLILIIYIVARLLADKEPLREEISLSDKGIISQVYGEIDFKAVKYTIEDHTAGQFYFLRIFLDDGTKLTWERSDAKNVLTEDHQKLSEFCQFFVRAFQRFKEATPPDFPRHHKFTFLNEKGYFYFLLCFLFVPFLFIPDDINDLGLWTFPIIFIPLIGGIIFALKKTVHKEEITLYQDHLLSKEYGRIDFKTIAEITSTEDWRRPTLILNLKNGRKVFWKTATVGPNQSEKELKLMYAEISYFISDFFEVVDGYSGTTDSSEISHISPERKAPEKTVSETLPNLPPIAAADKKPSYPSKELSSSAKSHSIPHTRKKGVYIGLPIGIVVAALILARNCTGEYQKKQSPFYQFQEKTENVQQQALSLLNDFTAKNAPYYLYTNRDSIEIFYYPTKKENQEVDQTDLLLEKAKQEYTPGALRKSNETMDFYRQMRYAQQYPDSVTWQMVLQNPKTSIPLKKTILNRADSTDTYLYLAYFIPDAYIERTPAMRAYAKRKGLPETEDQSGAIAIPVYADSSIKEYLMSDDFPLQRFLYLWDNYADRMQVYLAAQPQESGISEEQFKEVSSEILDVFEAEGMEIDGFIRKVLP